MLRTVSDLSLATPKNTMSDFTPYREKMENAAVNEVAIISFQRNYDALVREETGMISEDSITPCEGIPMFSDVSEGHDEFDFTNWGKLGLPKVSPLWLLKYLPNMPASHIAIYNDFRGPNNSITLREASANLAFGEAYCTIVRNNADTIVSGATGTRIHPIRSIHACIQEQIAHARIRLRPPLAHLTKIGQDLFWAKELARSFWRNWKLRKNAARPSLERLLDTVPRPLCQKVESLILKRQFRF